MKREYILGVLLFGGLWGLSEAVLGNALYAANVPHASVPLTAVALAVLTLARARLGRRGTGTLVAACAMLYKFLNAPFFGCHLLGIVLTGISYDLVFDGLKIRSKPLGAAAVTYLSYAAFAVAITYGFRYAHWVQGGLGAVLGHILVEGSMAALLCAGVVPLTVRLGERLRDRPLLSFGRPASPIPGGLSLLTAGLWAFAIVMCLLSSPLLRS